MVFSIEICKGNNEFSSAAGLEEWRGERHFRLHFIGFKLTHAVYGFIGNLLITVCSSAAISDVEIALATVNCTAYIRAILHNCTYGIMTSTGCCIRDHIDSFRARKNSIALRAQCHVMTYLRACTQSCHSSDGPVIFRFKLRGFCIEKILGYRTPT